MLDRCAQATSREKRKEGRAGGNDIRAPPGATVANAGTIDAVHSEREFVHCRRDDKLRFPSAAVACKAGAQLQFDWHVGAQGIREREPFGLKEMPGPHALLG